MTALLNDQHQSKKTLHKRSHPHMTAPQPHKGDLTLFNDPANLESVCWRCHSGAIQSEEALGYDTTIGADGWPIDPKHPMSKF